MEDRSERDRRAGLDSCNVMKDKGDDSGASVKVEKRKPSSLRNSKFIIDSVTHTLIIYRDIVQPHSHTTARLSICLRID